MIDHLFVEELRDRFNAGETFDWLYFWGHKPSTDGTITKTCFSQWFESPFVVASVHYQTAEQFMMAAKARLFKDTDTLTKIMNTSNPGAAKALGRRVQGFNDNVWLEHRFAIVCEANRAKFSQNKALKDFIMQTGTKILVEASPNDRIWGIGLSSSDPKANNPNQWQGLNLLGFALMAIREEFKNEVAKDGAVDD